MGCLQALTSLVLLCSLQLFVTSPVLLCVSYACCCASEALSLSVFPCTLPGAFRFSFLFRSLVRFVSCSLFHSRACSVRAARILFCIPYYVSAPFAFLVCSLADFHMCSVFIPFCVLLALLFTFTYRFLYCVPFRVSFCIAFSL